MNITMDINLIGAGLASISLIGSGLGIGILFGLSSISISLNPNFYKNIFSFTLLGFALCEAIALFGLMLAFIILMW